MGPAVPCVCVGTNKSGDGSDAGQFIGPYTFPLHILFPILPSVNVCRREGLCLLARQVERIQFMIIRANVNHTIGDSWRGQADITPSGSCPERCARFGIEGIQLVIP
jgi:hypothetical protein